jgi:hypothetical protein
VAMAASADDIETFSAEDGALYKNQFSKATIDIARRLTLDLGGVIR